MDTLTYIQNKFNLDFNKRSPIEIPNFGRDQMAELFAELGFNIGAEIGVEQGVYSEVLLKANEALFLYCIDAWQAHKGYRDHTRQEKLSRFLEITEERLSPYKNRHMIIRNFSMDAVKSVRDESLDFVYIDANHDFINSAQDTYYWSKKVKKGGIVAGHDFIDRKDDAAHVHVKQMLYGFTDAYRIKPWFVLGTQAKVEGQIRDSSRSWMFIKQ